MPYYTVSTVCTAKDPLSDLIPLDLRPWHPFGADMIAAVTEHLPSEVRKKKRREGRRRRSGEEKKEVEIGKGREDVARIVVQWKKREEEIVIRLLCMNRAYACNVDKALCFS